MPPGHAEQTHLTVKTKKKYISKLNTLALPENYIQLGQTALGTKGIKMPKSLEPNTHLCKTFSAQATQEGVY
jgi:hypothetical protein